MKTTHTPGPWKIENDNRADYMLTIRSESARLGIAYSCKDDARLIASAPELLAALHNLLETSPADIEAEDDPWKYRAFVKRVARAAIAKAEGNA